MPFTKIRPSHLIYFGLLIIALSHLGMAKSTPVIKIGKTVITKERIDSLVTLLSKQQMQNKSLSAKEKLSLARMVAGNLVGQKLLILEAKKKKISASPAETDSLLEKFKSNFPSISEYRNALSKAGDTETSLKKKLGREIQIEKLLKTRLNALTRPSEKEMKDFFQKYQEKLPKNDTLRASQIVLKISKNASVIKAEEARKKLESIRNELVNINLLDERLRQFTQAALKYSETPEAKVGGDLNTFQYGDFIKEFDEEIKTLKVGHISPVFRTPLGYHLILLTEKNDGSYDNYRLKILQHLLAKQTVNNQEELEKMLKELIKKYKVIYLDKTYKGSLTVNLKRKEL